MVLKTSVNAVGDKRILLITSVGPKTSEPDAEPFFEVHLTDTAGKVPPGIRNPLFGPLSIADAVEAAEKYAEDNKLCLSEDESIDSNSSSEPASACSSTRLQST
jgi:hypothetical protein